MSKLFNENNKSNNNIEGHNLQNKSKWKESNVSSNPFLHASISSFFVLIVSLNGTIINQLYIKHMLSK